MKESSHFRNPNQRRVTDQERGKRNAKPRENLGMDGAGNEMTGLPLVPHLFATDAILLKEKQSAQGDDMKIETAEEL
jgi:hypothetical protein